MKTISGILLMLLMSCGLLAQTAKDNLYRIYVTEAAQVQNIESKGVNVYNSRPGEFIDVIASPEHVYGLELTGAQIEYLAGDFKELVGARLKSGSYEDYHNHSETIELMNDFATTFPEITKLDTIGTSVLGREICSIKISDNPDVDEDEIPILIVGCHHGNEVLSVEATLYQIDFLLNNYYSDEEVKNWIDSYEIWYVPLVNPDGREDLRRTNNNWVDLNRNYDAFHTASDNHGAYGFSEPETQAIRDLTANFPPALSLTYHTSGRLVLLPWTHTDDAAPDSLAFTYLGNIIAESLSFPGSSGTEHYELRQGGDWYFTAGEYCDYMYLTHNTHAYTVEMWTIQTPPAEVIPEVVERNLEGMKTLFRQAEKAAVSGRVTDRLSGQPVVAEIDFPVFDKQGKIPARFTNEAYGRYYKYLEPGNYEMVVSAYGYRTVKQDISISADSLLNLDVAMDPSPDLDLYEFELNDSGSSRISGNGDGRVNIGETPGIFITLNNNHSVQGKGCYVKVSAENPDVELLTDSLFFGSVNHYSNVTSADTLLFRLSPDFQDGETINFKLDIADEVGFAWENKIIIEAYTPEVQVSKVIIGDETGNNNGIIDNGETINFGLRLDNSGRQGISNAILTLHSNDQYISISKATSAIQELTAPGDTFCGFELQFNSSAPDIYSSYVMLDISCDQGYHSTINIRIDNINGFFDDFENGENGWTHESYQTSQNHHDDWQIGLPNGKAGDPSFAFSGTNCWGTDLGWDLYQGESWDGEYQNNVYNYLESPSIDCSDMTHVGLRYRRWLNIRVVDIALIKVNDVIVWKSPAMGNYDQEWFEHLIDISDFADGNPDVKIKFELHSSNNNTLGGWNIDDFLLANNLAGSTSAKTFYVDNIDNLNCYPNPFSYAGKIEYKVSVPGIVQINVINTLGKVVKTLVNKYHPAGEYSLSWNGSGDSGYQLGNGIYFVRMKTPTEVLSQQLLMLK